MMEIKSENKPMTFDEVLRTPELSELHDIVRFLEKTPNKEIFPRKYEMSMEDVTIKEVRKIFKNSPQQPIKAVITAVLNRLPNDLSDVLLLKMTQIAVQEWRTLSQNAPVQERVLETV
jgi:hypothetical protein